MVKTEREKVFLMPFCNFNDINPVDAGWQDCPAGYKFGPHARSYHILHYVVSGKGVLYKNNTGRTVAGGQCFIIRSGEDAAYISDSKDPWSYIWLGFNTSLPLPEPLDKSDVFEADICRDVFLSIKALSPTDGNLDYMLCRKCWELFSLLGANAERSAAEDAADRAKTYIDNAIRNSISVADIADKLFIERTTFSKIFKMRFGVSPQEYLCSCRLEEAYRLIKLTPMQLSDIAASCGYNDYVNFSKMFTKKYGISPKKLRLSTIGYKREKAD